MATDPLFWIIVLPVAGSAILAAVLAAWEARYRRRLRLEGRTVMAHVSSLGYDPGD